MFKPLLAHTISDTSALRYPVLASVKLDGIRCVVIDGVAMSRNLKPIKNKWVQECIGRPEYNGLDGELIVGDIFAKDCYRQTNSGVMKEAGKPDFAYHVFDRFDMPEFQFQTRLGSLPSLPFVKLVDHWEIESEYQLISLEAEMLDRGAEGLMVRSLDGKYKNGRSTEKEGILGKLKRFADAEYEVVGYVERMENQNEKVTDALGHSKRSSHQENKVGRGDLGAIICKTPEGLEFNCGSGFNDADRAKLWAIKDNGLIGRIAKIKHFDYGVKDRVRFPTFLGFRSPGDM